MRAFLIRETSDQTPPRLPRFARQATLPTRGRVKTQPASRVSIIRTLNRIRIYKWLEHRPTTGTVDVCLIVEGAYPYVSGGVSSWVHGLIRRQPDAAILRRRHPARAAAAGIEIRRVAQPRGPAPSLPLGVVPQRRLAPAARFNQAKFDEAVGTFLHTGGLPELARIIELLAPLVKARRTADLLDSDLAWKLVCDLYDRAMPHELFLHFFWAWRALFGGLVATLSFPLPPARVYHTVSTGYAGLLAARAAIETGRPMLITEHGIYTHERRIEILQADWIVDTVDKGFAIHDPRR